MSTAEIPSLKKKSKDAYDAFEEINPSEHPGFPKVSNLFRINVSRAIDTSRHTMETNIDPNSNAIISITKRSQMPVTQAVSVVSQQLSADNISKSMRRENVSDIITFQQNQNVSTASGKSMARQSKRKQKNWFSDDMHIQDAKYKEMTDEIVDELEYEPHYVSDGFREEKSSAKKAPKKIHVMKQMTGPVSIQAISLQKRKTRSELVNAKPNRPSKARNNRNGDDWLIDEMFDQVVKVAKGAGEVAMGAGKVGKAIAREGFHATKTGIRAIGELATEFEKTPMAKNLNRNIDAEYSHMRSHAKRIRESIAGTANIANKRTRTAASLITQHTIGTKTTTDATSGIGATNQYGFFGLYEYGKSGKLELHYYHKDKSHRLTHDQVRRILTPKQIHLLKQEAVLGHNAASTTTVQANLGNNTGTIAKNPVKRKLNQPWVATTSGLVRRHRARVV
jgi:hypothetical protein